jgi:hypothetical protein
MENTPLEMRCNFAWPGTYGHECGATAVFAAASKSDRTTTGIYFARRCESCAKIKGGENAGILRLEPFNAEKHANTWK